MFKKESEKEGLKTTVFQISGESQNHKIFPPRPNNAVVTLAGIFL